METSRETHHEITMPTSAFHASNDNLRSQLSLGRSLLPEDAVARIFRPSRSVTTSGTARTKGWRLVFERRSAPFIEPLMGHTGGHDTLTQVELEFPTLQSAIRYAERQGLSYVVQRRATKPARRTRQPLVKRPKRSSHAFSDTTLERLGLSALQDSYDQALDGAAILDPALLRAGRIQILNVHLKKAKLAPEVDVEQIAALTPGFTGADLANLVNEATLLATRRKADAVSMDDFNNAIERIVAGLEKRNRLLNPKEREIVAHHEMGHALVAMALPCVDPVHKISIIPRGIGALGYPGRHLAGNLSRCGIQL